MALTLTGGGNISVATGTPAIQIDSSNRTTHPNVIAFKYGLSNATINGESGSGAQSGNRRAGTAAFPVNSGRDAITSPFFNTTTGLFTAPVAGVYCFGVTTMRGGSGGSGPIDMQICKNDASGRGQALDTTYGRLYQAAYSAVYEQHTITMITRLAINDYVTFDFTGNMTIYEDDSWIYGYLIG